MSADVLTQAGSELQGGRVGEASVRPDAMAKLRGAFAFASDLSAPGELHAATLRSPYARARIARRDASRALAIPGVRAVITAADLPGSTNVGIHDRDQPVLADGECTYWGEPIAVVAADTHSIALAAVAALQVEFELLSPVLDPARAAQEGAIAAEVHWHRGPKDVRGEVVVEGYYEIGMQDQAPLGPEAGLAIPDGLGGVDIHATTQWLHRDRDQIASALGLPLERVRVHPVGIGGAFGAREDLSVQVHIGVLALLTGRPVRAAYSRSESFAGHVHRHPARMWYRHEASRDGSLVRVEAAMLFDGGAFASTSTSVLRTAASWAVGPYRCPSVKIDGVVARTNNPPCGAMRGFGALQSCFGYESQMDRLAEQLGVTPLEIRRRNALHHGDAMPVTGQRLATPLLVTRCIDEIARMPMPVEARSPAPHIRRGTGYALGIKNSAFPAGADDFAEAVVGLTPTGVEVRTAAVEMGQGLTVVLGQIARTVMNIDAVRVIYENTGCIASAGSSSSSRQTQVSGRAVHDAAVRLRDRILARYSATRLDGVGVWVSDKLVADLQTVCTELSYPSEAVRFRHPPTQPPAPDGTGDVHADVAVAAHRAVVDVDVELGIVRVVHVATAQDVGKAINPAAVVGQIEGGIVQGLGLALFEELTLRNGTVTNASFTDYLLPTIVDAPPIDVRLIEEGGSWGPFGAKGVGEPPIVSSPAAIVAAVRDATGRALHRMPVTPEDIAIGSTVASAWPLWAHRLSQGVGMPSARRKV